MYRIFCESYNNYIKDFEPQDARLGMAALFRLIVDADQYRAECQSNSLEYKMLSDLIYYASQNIERYPRLEAFLWTLSSRGIEPRYFGLSDKNALEEQVKLINSFLKLSYWE